MVNFIHIHGWVWHRSSLRDPDAAKKLSFTLPMNLALIGQAVSKEEKFEYNGHIHVYSPRQRAENPLRSNLYHKYKSSVNLIICCKFSH